MVTLRLTWILIGSAIAALLVVASIQLYRGSEVIRLGWRVQWAEKRLARSLAADGRFSNVTANGWPQRGGLIQCGGFVNSTNDLDALNQLLSIFSSNSFPVLNKVFVRNQ